MVIHAPLLPAAVGASPPTAGRTTGPRLSNYKNTMVVEVETARTMIERGVDDEINY